MNAVARSIGYVTWVMVCYFLSQFVVDRFVAYADQRAVRQPDPGPVAPPDRVDHVVTDDDSRMLESLKYCILFALLLAPLLWIGWHLDAGPQEKGFALACTWAVLLVPALFGLRSLQLALRYLQRLRRRMQLHHKLLAERRAWDPAGRFPLIFVIHRDISEESVELFDRLTLACYRKGLAVMQYCDMEWPVYSQVHVSTTGNVWTVPNENPDVVAKASAVVWLAIDPHSKATEAELAKARELEKPLLRVAHGSGGYVIEGDGHSVHEPDAQGMASRVANWLAELTPDPQGQFPIQ